MTMQLFSTGDYFKIDIANNFGLDKKDWNERLAWFEDNKGQLFDLKDEADEPAQYLKAVHAYFTALETGQTQHIMRLDATASGYQCVGAMFSDATLMRNCNIIDVGKRVDAYQIVSNRMKVLLNDASFEVLRSDAKSACMKGAYGSTKAPEEVFGTGDVLLKFYEAVEIEAPCVPFFNELCLRAWNPKALNYQWTMPDLFHVEQVVEDILTEPFNFLGTRQSVNRYVNKPIKRGRSLGANMTHSIDSLTARELVRMAIYNPDKVKTATEALQYNGRRASTEDDRIVDDLATAAKTTGYLSARIIDHVCPENVGYVNKDQLFELLTNLPDNPFHVSLIHDCFGAMPQYMNSVRKLYNYLMFKLAQSNLLNVMLFMITGNYYDLKKINPEQNHLILEANYALS